MIFLLAGLLAVQAAAAPADSEPPATRAALLERQELARRAAERVIPSIVAIKQATQPQFAPRHHQPSGSGVIITADGLILSQYHVSHMVDPSSSEKSRKPGERITVITYDGREHEAELLGADLSFDLSLLKLTLPGPYPFSPLDEQVTVSLGDFVLKFGYPLGYRPGRRPVARLGRVVCRQEDTFVSDCLMNGGDSGGPLVDLSGRLIGIVRAGLTNHPLRPIARSGTFLFTCSTNLTIHSCLEPMLKGQIVTASAEVVTRSMADLERAPSLDLDDWTQGADIRQAFREVVKPVMPSVVLIKHGTETVALGTIVGADGWIVTKASELPAEPSCELPNGQVAAAEIKGVDPADDLALLKVPVNDLRAIEWTTAVAPSVGTILAAPGPQMEPLAWGIVSVALRELAGPFPKDVSVRRPRIRAAPLELTGRLVEGSGYRVEQVSGPAASAGIQSGDVLLTIGTTTVQSNGDLATCVEGRWAGEQIAVRLLRDGMPLDLTLILAGRRAVFSARNDDFPVVFEHDAPLMADECGGPVVGLDGKALGITIARVSAHGCMAIPADRIQSLVQTMKSGKAADSY